VRWPWMLNLRRATPGRWTLTGTLKPGRWTWGVGRGRLNGDMGRAASPMTIGAIALGTVLCVGCTPLEPGRSATGNTGAVTADHPLAADAGLRVLQAGGNAIDAAITMAAMLAVARPHMNGLGGDMFLLYYDAASDSIYALNASGRSGSSATLEQLKGAGLTEMPETGPRSVSVPGAVGGWASALERFGTLSWQEALEPARALAADGLPVSQRLAMDIAEQRSKLEAEPEAAVIFLPNGEPPVEGSILTRPLLAQTLERLQAAGPSELYTGETGRRILDFLSERNGLLQAADLAAYQPVWTEPIRIGYHDLNVIAFPPNTQGVTLLSELAMMSHFDVQALGHNTADYLHTVTEVIRLAFGDRDSSIADPDYMRVSVDDLLNQERLRQMAAGIEPSGMAAAAMVASANDDHPNTVYVSAVDSSGNTVSLIQSLFHSFGSGLVVPETGIVLHNRGSLFRFDDNHPNVFGPARRPYHTLSPAMVTRNGRPWLTFGTPGGDGQTQTLIQVLHNIQFFGMTPQEAIDAPRIRRLPNGSLAVEERISSATLEELATRGYNVLTRVGLTAEFGGAQAILIDPNGFLTTGADRRREAWALAY